MYSTMTRPKETAKKNGKANNTGIPTQLKEQLEENSGFSFDDVMVHYNSSKPAELSALAFTQGNQVYMGPGQEKHLPHELGHIAQQKQGIVKPTNAVNGIQINDDDRLERAADFGNSLQDEMNAVSSKSLQLDEPSELRNAPVGNNVYQLMLSKDHFNVVGEEHPETDARVDDEKAFCFIKTDSTKYFREDELLVGNAPEPGEEDTREEGDPVLLRFDHTCRNLVDTFVAVKDVDIYETTPRDFDDEEREENNEKNKAQYGELLKESQAYISGLCDGRFGRHLPNKARENLRSILAAVNAAVICYNQWTKKKGPFSSFEKTLLTLFEQREAVLGELRKEEQIVLSRSKAMHNAANAMKEKRGVWKIGNAHYDEIIGNIDSEEIEYSITSRDEFNEEYDQWVAEKPFRLTSPENLAKMKRPY